MNELDLVRKIHDTPGQGVLAITGGGSEAIGRLLRHGNGSNTLLEAVVPYDQNAFTNFVGGKPDKFCSESAARNLAMASYQRAVKLLRPSVFDRVFGIGATCSLTKENERQGREHHAYVAIQTRNYTASYSWNLFNGSREVQENFVGKMILRAVAEAKRLQEDSLFANPAGGERRIGIATGGLTDLGELIIGERKYLFVPLRSDAKLEDFVIYPGAFHPFHQGHHDIAWAANKYTEKNVVLEICLDNVDKPFLDYIDVDERLSPLLTFANPPPKTIPLMTIPRGVIGVLLTRTPTFAEKAELFPDTTFVVGADTLVRIGDPKYYEDLDKAMDRLWRAKARFLVFPRNKPEGGPYIPAGGVRTIPAWGKWINIPVEPIPEAWFRGIDISSTELRREKK